MWHARWLSGTCSPAHCKAAGCWSKSDLRRPLSATSAAQAEYVKLQALYEDLKAAKIDEEVQQLLEQQNRHVTEHGQKAAALVEHFKAEVGAAALGAARSVTAYCCGHAKQLKGLP